MPIKEVAETEEQDNNNTPEKQEIQKVTLSNLCRVPVFVFGLLAQVVVYGSLGFLSPTMSLHLLSYEGFDEFWVGVYFGVPVILYILNTPLVSIYCKLFNRRCVIFIGACCFSVGVLLIGTSPMLGFPDQT